MSASPSSPSTTKPIIPATEFVAPSKKNFTLWRPILACGGALLLGLNLIRFTAPTTTAMAPASVTSGKAPEPLMALSASQLVEARAVSALSSHQTMRGQWKYTTDVTGKAQSAGAVARWVVEPGSHVEAGQSVVEISSGSASRPASGAEHRQDQAEKEQIAAASGQSALAQKLSMAQIQLSASQERVEQAQKKVSATRALVKRLLAGEKIPATSGATKSNSRSEKPENPDSTRLNSESKRAQEAVSEARDDADKSKADLDDAKKALTKAQKKVDSATTALTKAEADFKEEKTTADVLQNARADLDDAQSTLKAAQTRADVAQRAYATAQEKVSSSESNASNARDKAQKAAQAPAEEPTTGDDENKYMTADQAAVLVAEALSESKTATRQAERVHARVEDYQRQVRQTSQRVESASQNLQTAQNDVLESAPRPVFTSTVAPISGTVTWISRLAREVGVGQSVFGISRGQSGFLRFEDKTGAWKNLKVGQTLDAAPSSSSEPQQVANTSASANGDSAAMPTSAALSATTPLPVPTIAPALFSVRITRITPPTGQNEPATIEAVRTDGKPTSSTGSDEVQAQLPLSALPATAKEQMAKMGPQPILLPLSVILPRDGSSYVAVVSPSKDEEQKATLQWRSVHIERQSAFDVEIKSGLKVGEQVVAQPILLLSELKPEQKAGIPVIIQASD